MNRPNDAMPLLEALSKESAHFADAKARIAAIQFAQGKKAEANKTVDEVLAKQPNNAMLLLAKARLLLADRNVNEAVVEGEGGGHRRPALDWRALHARQPAGVARRGRRGDGLVP